MDFNNKRPNYIKSNKLHRCGVILRRLKSLIIISEYILQYVHLTVSMLLRQWTQEVNTKIYDRNFIHKNIVTCTVPDAVPTGENEIRSMLSFSFIFCTLALA